MNTRRYLNLIPIQLKGEIYILDLSELMIKLFVLLTPGAVYMKVYRNLQACKDKKDWEDYFEMTFISIVSYLIYSLLISIDIPKLCFNFKETSSLGLLTDKNFEVNLIEVFFATLISILLSFLSSYLKRTSFLNRLGMNLKVTDRFGIEDLWYRFNQIKEMEWVTIRDYKANLDYYGYIKNYSDSDEKREMIMENVTVFKDGTNIEYYVDRLYISREFDDFSIEYYDFSKEENEDGKECER